MNRSGRASPGARRRATRADVAELAGTSTAVVRSLRLQRTRALGLVVPDLANPFFAELASAIELHASEYGEALLLGNSLDSEDRESDNLRTFIDYRVDGLIVVPVSSGGGSLSLLREFDMPVVILDRTVPGAGAPTVLPDNAAGAAAATDHLLAHGYESVGCVAGPEEIFTAEERLQGWRTAVERVGLRADERLVVRSEFDRDAACRAATRLLSGPARPRALFVSSDEQAFGVLRASARLGLRVPDDLALVGFDGLRHSQSTVPRLATMRQPFGRFGKLAVELVHRQPPATADEIIRLPVTLQAGGTCGCADDVEEGV